ncbi:argininosuccinate lyase [Mycoplasmopsis pullorum]|uniref:argininosuccinate lyase n=1 Tax=Mycoplasmopsis pullorum TaxID=48003 RepID=UPI001119D77F|nr:argininosuccinate lyase [Mycoplasmopsis pullorum]TNK82194.1 argininosuccinate lyase [Mycoplasmopsis pullorum]TNK83180.1 argininosuccinate lyase [Mycoplasmopsis pullorum]TNK84678.1 argininosuccinate lyase [Mycoplasmopsis pullorum]TNK85465.1 argininosuccinate lyase [Mycoplasmopsis pullorum]TNK85893.1 argininosuccinate lyase [Mycoplasmopsis pullorum]
MSKLWAGRFSKETDSLVDQLNSSIKFDQRMFCEDIDGTIAHAKMLNQIDILSSEELQLLEQELYKIKNQIISGELIIDENAEDIHMFIEAELTKRIGDIGKKVHTGRSRNDQVAVDLRMYLKKEIKFLQSLILNLIKVLKNQIRVNLDTIMPGYTHLQKAQTITFAHHLFAYVDMFLRDFQRLNNTYSMMNYSPLGAGALATSTHTLKREFTTQELGFNGVILNSLDAVSDRDYVIALASDLSILIMHLSRFSEEIILWSTNEFNFITLDDAYSTGSSMMPQKKNPDIAELTRGKTGRVFGNLISLLTIMKGLPLAYNKDLQEDKEAIFDSVDTLKQILPVFSAMIATWTVNKEKMLNSAKSGFLNATDLADYLVKKQIPFREAHHIVGKIVALALSLNKEIDQLTLAQLQSIDSRIESDVFDAIDIYACVNAKNIIGGPSIAQNTQRVKALELIIEQYKQQIK